MLASRSPLARFCAVCCGLQLTTTEVVDHGDFVVTRINLSNGHETRQISHFWFTAWPDHGVPGG